MTTGFVDPLGELVQLDGDNTHVSCNTKPGVTGDHEIMALPGANGTMVSVGAPATCTAVGNAQKPPVTDYWPPVIGRPVGGVFAANFSDFGFTAKPAS